MSRRWILLSLVFIAILINYVDRGNLSVAAPAMMRDFRITPATMGVLLSAFFWTYAACQIPAGAVVDRFGIRGTYAAAFLVWSLASAAIALSRGPGDVIGLRVALGLAEAIAPLASVSFIRNNFRGKDQGLPTAIYIAGQNFGPALGVLAGAMLLDKFGWRAMFAVTGLGALAWVPCWLVASRSRGIRSAPPPVKVAADSPAARSWTWRVLLADRTFWAMSFSILLSSYYWYFVLTWVPSYLILSRGFSTMGMGKVLSTALFTMAIVNIAAGAAADRLAARIGVFHARLWFGVLGFAGTAAILLLLVTSRAWALPILTVSLCATGVGNSNYWTITQHASPKNLVGRAVGFLNTLSATAGIAAPVITGWLLGPEKRFGPAILVAGICPVLAAACLLAAGPKGLGRIKTLLAGEAYSGA
jgi:MFS transporter, ACS family, D-galactonate transporter